MLEFVYGFLVWLVGIGAAIIALIGKTYLEQASKLHAHDWYAQYRAKRK